MEWCGPGPKFAEFETAGGVQSYKSLTVCTGTYTHPAKRQKTLFSGYVCSMYDMYIHIQYEQTKRVFISLVMVREFLRRLEKYWHKLNKVVYLEMKGLKYIYIYFCIGYISSASYIKTLKVLDSAPGILPTLESAVWLANTFEKTQEPPTLWKKYLLGCKSRVHERCFRQRDRSSEYSKCHGDGTSAKLKTAAYLRQGYRSSEYSKCHGILAIWILKSAVFTLVVRTSTSRPFRPLGHI